MINEATLIISLLILFFLIFVSVGYLFFIFIERLEMTGKKSTLYISAQVLGSVLLTFIIYHFLSPYVDPSGLYIENLRNYSFYYVLGWNAFFAIMAAIFFINAICHHIYARKKERDWESQHT
ncbi:hypothetical protein LGQ02_16450 [Bacillus shivajii]|uniref:hypothetical protein n=1 Tax=Bacillus shivajii TaxID=1983719 RepID=UPI001CFA9AE4|nr:hypothetical protein [Bacillus shivajii]UCZ52414.1 hypothetical protein LGQ02_16450 [Bacillus shivajii]